MTRLYLLSGLGADRRIFDFIDFSRYETTYVEWIPPLANESMEAYASRLKSQIDSPSPTLVGVSFGGMMAIELSRQLRTEKVVIISSARGRKEIPLAFRLLGKTGIQRILPSGMFKTLTPLTFWLFGAHSVHQKDFLKKVIRSTDEKFLKWAIDKIVTWQNEYIPENLVTLHGSRDRILPAAQPDFEITGGGHLMIISHSQMITQLLHKLIQ